MASFFGKIAATGGLGYAMSKSENVRDATAALTGSKNGPLQPRRTELDTASRRSSNPSHFTGIVQGVNQGMGVNTGKDISPFKKNQYVDLMKRTDNGSMKGSAAMMTSASGWAHEKNYAAATLNVIGGIGMGIHEGVF